MTSLSELMGLYYEQRIAVVGKKGYFISYRDALVRCISSYGFEVKGYLELEDALNDNPTCVIVICPVIYKCPPKNKSIIWVAIQTEQLYSEAMGGMVFGHTHINQLKAYLKYYDIVLDWSNDNAETLKKYRDRVFYFPHSYFEELEIVQNVKKVPEEEKYDILFIGNMPGVNQRREKALKALMLKYNVYPIRNDLWGEKKALALAGSKICINIHFEESRCMESPRLYDYFANRCFVLSEPIHSSYPFVAGDDYIDFYWTDIENKIDYYLSHYKLRQSISTHAYETAKKSDLLKATKILIDSILLFSYEKEFDFSKPKGIRKFYNFCTK